MATTYRTWKTTEIKRALARIRGGDDPRSVIESLGCTRSSLKQICRAYGFDWGGSLEEGKLRRRARAVAEYRRSGDADAVAAKYGIKRRALLRWVQLSRGGDDGRTYRRKITGQKEARLIDLRREGASMRACADDLGVGIRTVWATLQRIRQRDGAIPLKG